MDIVWKTKNEPIVLCQFLNKYVNYCEAKFFIYHFEFASTLLLKNNEQRINKNTPHPSVIIYIQWRESV